MYIFNIITFHFLNPKTSTDSVVITIKLSRAFFFTDVLTKNFTICMETQMTLNNESNLEKEEQSWRNQPS